MTDTIPDVAIGAITAELEQIAESNGGMLPASAVVDFARDPSTALHSQFEWDDSAAAEAWRLQQARKIIARIVIEPRPNVVVRAWCSLPADRLGESPVYRPTLTVLSDADLRAQLLASVLEELGRLRHKHANLTELAHVWKVIDETVTA